MHKGLALVGSGVAFMLDGKTCCRLVSADLALDARIRQQNRWWACWTSILAPCEVAELSI